MRLFTVFWYVQEGFLRSCKGGVEGYMSFSGRESSGYNVPLVIINVPLVIINVPGCVPLVIIFSLLYCLPCSPGYHAPLVTMLPWLPCSPGYHAPLVVMFHSLFHNIQVFDMLMNGDIYPYPTYFYNITGCTDYYNILNCNVSELHLYKWELLIFILN